jgi:hypothetical protein
VEEEDSIACAYAEMIELDDEEKNMMSNPQNLKKNMTNEEEESLKLVTLKTKTCSNDVSNTSREVGYAQNVRHKKK